MAENLFTWADVAIAHTRTKTIQKLDSDVVDVLTNKLGFANVTKVQYAVVPLFLSNKDVCVKACTGSGKTLSFVIPLVSRLLNMQKNNELESLESNQVLALLLAPSRELAI